WLHLFAATDCPPARSRRLVIDYLLTQHRERLEDHLSRDELDVAQATGRLVRELPELAHHFTASLSEEITTPVGRFEDDLVTHCLLGPREAMRFGDVPEGWRADYERGLKLLSRLASVTDNSVRLLTALVETCVEWFVDLYHQSDTRRLAVEADRYS